MDELKRRFRVTHPFHPLSGKVLDLVDYRRSWGQEWVDGLDEEGNLVSMPMRWTDAAEGEDPFLAASAGRSYFRVEDLIRLVVLIREVSR